MALPAAVVAAAAARLIAKKAAQEAAKKAAQEAAKKTVKKTVAKKAVAAKKPVVTPAQRAKAAASDAERKARLAASTPNVRVVKAEGGPYRWETRNDISTMMAWRRQSGEYAKTSANKVVKGAPSRTIKVNSAPKRTPDAARSANAKALKAANKGKKK